MCNLTDKSGIYKIHNINNDKIYVGSALNLRTRWNRHKSELKRNVHCNKHLQNAWNKYGHESFVYEILEIVESSNELQVREQHWLIKLESCNPAIGYNILNNAYNSTGYKHSNETKNKISDMGKKRYKLGAINPMKGVIMSKESKLRMSLSKQGIYKGKNNPFYGKRHKENSIRKISETKLLTAPKGSNHPRSKLTEEQVIKIKLLLRDTDYKSGQIANIIGVKPEYIYDIKANKSWTHINIDNVEKVLS